ncbi:MAG TPA: dienelactone hydrolase family protein [Bdellovibrionales bacterium]|nr:dienelactone hydrolase family protein [Bdellovibrionales bacterium]
MRQSLLFLMGIVMTLPGIAAGSDIRTQTIEYKDGNTVLEGFIAYNAKMSAVRPGILIVHEWMGLDDFNKERAVKLAELGYTALAVDIYGKGVRPKDQKEAAAVSSIYKSDRARMRRRIKAGYDALNEHMTVRKGEIAAIGYCFGGTTALELARSGAGLKGVVSFHGGLDTPRPEDAKKIKAKVLALHGADDPYVPAEQVAAFEDEMRKAGVDWQLVKYSKAVHSFTNPGAGSDNSKGVAYNAEADRRSWIAMQDFLKEIFQRSAL